MFRSIIDDIRYQFQTGNTITRLIIVNVTIFIAIILFKLVVTLSGGPTGHDGLFYKVVDYLYLSQDFLWNATHPWVIFTHMFTHVGLFHMIFNMLVLYWFGRIAGDLLGDHRMLPLYVYSGLTGAVFYLLTSPFFYPAGSTLHGASGAIMGIVAAAGMTAPDYQMRLLFFGDVRLKYIVFGLLFIYLVSLASLDNAGGQMAHFGGAAFGFFYVYMLRRGTDLTIGFRKMMTLFQKPKTRPSPPAKRRVPLEVRQRNTNLQRENQTRKTAYVDQQERLDLILDKIKRTGFNSLNEEEKQFLHDASQK